MIDYDFDEHGQLVIGEIVIPHDKLAEMLVKYQGGFCPIPDCGDTINQDEIICDNCFRRARQYREQYG